MDKTSNFFPYPILCFEASVRNRCGKKSINYRLFTKSSQPSSFKFKRVISLRTWAIEFPPSSPSFIDYVWSCRSYLESLRFIFIIVKWEQQQYQACGVKELHKIYVRFSLVCGLEVLSNVNSH